jgi:poly-beta-1,6 N-acetyl-D-glucosamine synthase
MVMSYLHHLDYQRHHEDTVEHTPDSELPLVSVSVPAFNEGVVIGASIWSLMELNYPRIEIIVVDDGSTDDTYERAMAFAGKHGNVEVMVFTKPNGGKARAHNFAISKARGEFILCVDADSRLEPDSLRHVMTHFGNPRVGAVAGNVKVINRNNLLTNMQALEYIEGLNMVRRSQGYLSAVNIIPGPLGVFRRSVLESVGGYDHDTFAEDCDLTIKILGEGWQVEYEPRAITWTEVPEKVVPFLRQRYRWTRGILQSLRKHSKFLLGGTHIRNRMVLWYMFFEAVLWPVMNIFANAFFLYVATFFSLARFVVFWFGQLTVLDIVVALYCISLEQEQVRLALYAPFYRIYFVLLTDVCKFIATFEEIFQVQMTWGKLERVGRI